uniref:Uncharacterized protein n=1 Tax=Amphimedon queenslandica TaxID=400682 RepID=A0A1X7SNN2_AMPQE
FCNEILVRNPSEAPHSSNSIIEPAIPIDYDIEEEYSAMYDQFVDILAHAIEKDVFSTKLDAIKLYLAGRQPKNTEKIKKISDAVDLIALLRSYYSLSNVPALQSFAQHCQLDHIKQKLDDLLKRRDKFYENILVKDFAKKAIKDHKMCETDSTITFKVSWDENETLLKEFEIFLTRAFKSHKIYIRLRVVCQSLLTFVCSIPNWLVEEITNYVNKNKDYLISEGVVSITIDSVVIFNVEGGYAALMFYEPDDMVKFTAVPSSQLPALLKFLKKNNPYSEVALIHYFNFKSLHKFITLNFCNEPPTGWTVTLSDDH